MTALTLILSVLTLAAAGAALWVALLSRGDSLTVRRELALHRDAHASGREERRVVRHRPAPEQPQEHDERAWLGRDPLPDSGEPTEELAAQHPPTEERPAVRLPRPGRAGGAR